MEPELAPLTDDELAQIDGMVMGNASTLRRLVADLRATRAEVDRLRCDTAEWERLHEDAERLCARCGAELEARR